MSNCRSEAQLRVLALAAVAGTMLCALAFFIVQNRYALTGGVVAPSKGLWLGLAVLFWLVLPALILVDPRIDGALKWPFGMLLLLMAARGVAELVMMYVFRNWSPRYGIAHDLLCASALWAWCAWRLAAPATGDAGPLARPLWRHALISGTLFMPEIYYAAYMQAHFTTQGEGAVYFVPDDGAHAQVLAVTAVVDALAVAYLVFFFYSWLHGKPRRTRS